MRKNKSLIILSLLLFSSINISLISCNNDTSLSESEELKISGENIVYVGNNELINGTSDPVALYEDLVEKGNVYKAEVDGYYSRYGVDGDGNE